VPRRVVFDTNSVVSSLLFATGRLAWLREHWRSGECVALVSRATAAELQRVLNYPKFRLEGYEQIELLGDYLPFSEIVEHVKPCPQTCRDQRDQMFLDLAFSASADVLMTGDNDLLALAGLTQFAIVSPEIYRQRCGK
jgi:putative PIN family toxin of toxin-antitoxin system